MKRDPITQIQTFAMEMLFRASHINPNTGEDDLALAAAGGETLARLGIGSGGVAAERLRTTSADCPSSAPPEL